MHSCIFIFFLLLSHWIRKAASDASIWAILINAGPLPLRRLHMRFQATLKALWRSLQATCLSAEDYIETSALKLMRVRRMEKNFTWKLVYLQLKSAKVCYISGWDALDFVRLSAICGVCSTRRKKIACKFQGSSFARCQRGINIKCEIVIERRLCILTENALDRCQMKQGQLLQNHDSCIKLRVSQEARAHKEFRAPGA
jgi:hypothetical protein